MTTEAFEGESYGATENGGYKDHGWKKVTNAKKQRRQEGKTKTGTAGQEAESKSKSTDSKAFQALEHEAEDRRARRDARIAAAQAGGESHSGEDDSDVDGEVRAQANGATEGEVKKPKVKKAKKPKVSVAEAAAAINPEELSVFLSGITVSNKQTLVNLPTAD
jgi:hypothetical protein